LTTDAVVTKHASSAPHTNIWTQLNTQMGCSAYYNLMKLQEQHCKQSNIPSRLCDLTAIAQPFSAEI